MMDKWPAKETGGEGASSGMPTPAAAPEPSPAQGSDVIRPRSSVSINNIKTGYIRVSSPGAGILYLSSANSAHYLKSLAIAQNGPGPLGAGSIE
ncbi:hypothetical protein FRC00_013050 [Tulasnella sp. 408]|nr:hypothetical protein FRC00_013050 [Tulasnella sp. 408]